MKTSIACAISAALCLAAVFACLGRAQSSAARPEFEVASVKFHPPAGGPLRASTGVGPAGIDFHNVTLTTCIRAAYGIPAYRIAGGPDWLASARYDVVAKAAAAASRAVLMQMLQALLEKRFQLQVHRETRELPVYALVAASAETKLRAGKEDGETEIGGAVHTIDSRGMTMKALAGALTQITQPTGLPVIDQTGFSGVYDIVLDLRDEAASGDDHSGPDLFAALRPLGLKLERRRSPFEVLVVDRAARPAEN